MPDRPRRACSKCGYYIPVLRNRMDGNFGNDGISDEFDNDSISVSSSRVTVSEGSVNRTTPRRTARPETDGDTDEFDIQKELELAIQQSRNEHHAPKLFELYLDHFHGRDENRHAMAQRNELVKEIREMATEKQTSVIRSMKQPSARVMILGSRKTGKSWVMTASTSLLGTGEPLIVKVLSSKKDTAKHIIWMMASMVPNQMIDQHSKEHLSLRNGTDVAVLPNTIAGTGTFEADILIIDEAQEVAQDIWDKVIPQLLTGRESRLYIAGTAKAGSRFEDVWFGEEALADDGERRFATYEFTREDAPWVSEEEWESAEALMSERMVRQELNLEWVSGEGVYFNSEMVEGAFEPFDRLENGNYIEVISAWDWGIDHQSVNIVLGVRKNDTIEEIDIWAKSNPSAEEIKTRCRIINEKWSPLFIFESSPLGSFVRSDLSATFHSRSSNFSHRKDEFIFSLAMLLDTGALRLENKRLKGQLKRYCGDKKDDDFVDALLHGCHYIYRKYMKNDTRRLIRRANKI
jgi:hypothetical protein